MAVKLRLTRVGKTKQPQYRIVAADSRSPRDGRFIEIVGHYNPLTDPVEPDRRQRQGRQVAAAGCPADRPGAQAARDLGRARAVHGEQAGQGHVVSDADDGRLPIDRRGRRRGRRADRRGRADPHRHVDRRRSRRRPGRGVREPGPGAPRRPRRAGRPRSGDRPARPDRPEHPHRRAGRRRPRRDRRRHRVPRRLSDRPAGLLEIGHLRQAHGVHGQVNVQLSTDRPERLVPGTRWYARDGWLTVVVGDAATRTAGSSRSRRSATASAPSATRTRRSTPSRSTTPTSCGSTS